MLLLCNFSSLHFYFKFLHFEIKVLMPRHSFPFYPSISSHVPPLAIFESQGLLLN